jgi:hypothetical protein
VQGHFRVAQHSQQACLVFAGLRDLFIQCLVAGLGPKQLIKSLLQPDSVLFRRVLFVLRQLPIIVPVVALIARKIQSPRGGLAAVYTSAGTGP